MASLTIKTANKNAEKLTKNENEAKKNIEEGHAILKRLMKTYAYLIFVISFIYMIQNILKLRS